MKINVIKTMQGKLEEKGLKVSQAETKEILKAMEETVAEVGKNLEVGETGVVGCLSLKRKDVAARTGVTKLRDVETEWSTPAHTKVDVKLRNPLRDSLKVF